jgi:hypothetical protein
MNTLKQLIGFSMMFQNTFSVDTDEWKQRILKEWKNSANYPRKKKKRVRKSLQIDWTLANYNPFQP